MTATNTAKTCTPITIFPSSPAGKTCTIPIVYDKTIYALRERIEIFFGKFKENTDALPSDTTKPMPLSSPSSPILILKSHLC